MTFIADRLKRIKPSMTVGINVKANALRAEGKDILVLAAGEPDFDTPENIKKRWKNNLSKKQILDIEMLFFRSIKKYGYSMENKITIINIVRAYYRALFMYKDDYNFFQNIFYTSKNIIRRIMILTNALYASKFIDLD